jgi:UDP-N-acetyl-2-amino-2-deoxyglucuronate dehydrogenase
VALDKNVEPDKHQPKAPATYVTTNAGTVEEIDAMTSIGTAIIGCGKVAYAHAEALSSLDESRFIGVFDINRARAKAFAQKYQVAAFADLGQLLSDPTVEMASICTPHYTHPDMIIACSQVGVHVLVEKPLAIDLKGADRALEAATEAGIKLGIVSQRRFYEPVQRVKMALETEKIGRPALGTLTVMGWRDKDYYQMDSWRGQWSTEGGGVLLTQTVHQIDLLQWFMGPIDEIYGYWANINHPYIEVEDTAVAVLRFKNGALGVLLLSNAQKPGFYGRIHVHGTSGASVGVQTDWGSPFVSGLTREVDPPINDVWTIPGENHHLIEWQREDTIRCRNIDVMTYYHRLQIKDFLEAIKDDREPFVSGQEGRKPVEIITAIYRSCRDGLPVKFPLDAEKGSEQFDGRLSKPLDL